MRPTASAVRHNAWSVLVVFDTTVLIADRFLESNAMRLLLQESGSRRLRVAVTEVTRQEAIAKYREEIEEAFGAIETARTKLARLRVDHPSTIPSTDAVAAAVTVYQQHLRDTFQNACVRVLDLPDIGHDAVIARALERRKPFDDKGQKGYRDVLIWETIKLQASGDDREIALISANHRDFAESGAGSGLARVLQRELDEIDVAGSVTLYGSVSAFVDEHVQPAVDIEAEITALLSENEEFRQAFDATLEAAIDDAQPDLSDLKIRSIEDDYDNVYEIDEAVLQVVAPGVSHVELVSARVINDSEALLELDAEADADIDFYLYRQLSRRRAWWHSEEKALWDEDRQHLPRSLAGTETQTLGLKVEATYQRQERTVADVRVVSARSL